MTREEVEWVRALVKAHHESAQAQIDALIGAHKATLGVLEKVETLRAQYEARLLTLEGKAP